MVADFYRSVQIFLVLMLQLLSYFFSVIFNVNFEKIIFYILWKPGNWSCAPAWTGFQLLCGCASVWPQASVNAKPQKMSDQKFHLDCSFETSVLSSSDISASLLGVIVAAHAQLVATLLSLVRNPPAWLAIGQAQGLGRWAEGNGTKLKHLHQ